MRIFNFVMLVVVVFSTYIFISLMMNNDKYINVVNVSEDGRNIDFTDMHLKISCEKSSEISKVSEVLEEVIKDASRKDYSNSQGLVDIEEGNPFVTRDKVYSYFEDVTEVKIICLYETEGEYEALGLVTKNNIITNNILTFKESAGNYILYYEDVESRPENETIALWWSYGGYDKIGFLSPLDMIIKIIKGEINWVTEEKYYYYFNVDGDNVLTDFYESLNVMLKNNDYERFYELFPVNDQKAIKEGVLQGNQLGDYYEKRELLGSMVVGKLGVSYFKYGKEKIVDYSIVNGKGVRLVGLQSEPYWNIYTIKVKGFSALRNDFEHDFNEYDLLKSVFY